MQEQRAHHRKGSGHLPVFLRLEGQGFAEGWIGSTPGKLSTAVCAAMAGRRCAIEPHHRVERVRGLVGAVGMAHRVV